MANELNDFHRSTLSKIQELNETIYNIQCLAYHSEDAQGVIKYLRGKIAALEEAISDLQAMRLLDERPVGQKPVRYFEDW